MNKKIQKIAVIIPCFNEEVSIGDVIKKFKKIFPKADIYVFNNNSTDNTKSEALEAGAIVRLVHSKGKGNVVRRMFADVEADIYVMVDGDGTYEIEKTPFMLQYFLNNHLDMLVASRQTNIKSAYRPGHRFGNLIITSFINFLFKNSSEDILSGFRIFSKRFVKTFPAFSDGFEIEVELTIHALEMRMPIQEIKTKYISRPEGSSSKLNTYIDGIKIFLMIIKLFKEKKPLLFFFLASILFFLISILLAVPIFMDFIATGLVPRLPTAILCSALMLLSSIMMAIGIILNDISKNRKIINYFHYLSFDKINN